MLLQPADKVLVAHRRLFESDAQRHFVGEVIAYADGVVKVRGFTFVRNRMTGEYLRKEDTRTKFVSLTSPAYMVYELPRATAIDAIRFAVSEEFVVLTDDAGLVMNMAESPATGTG